MALCDCKRAAQRGTGEPTRAAVVALDVWGKLPAQLGEQQGTWPDLRHFAWAFACQFLLREVEMSSVALSSREVALDTCSRQVTVRLSVSKADPAARGCSRTLACTCPRTNSLECPFCTAQILVRHQVSRTNTDPESEAAWTVPSIGRMDDPFRFVSKEAVVAALRADGRTLKAGGHLPAKFDVTSLSGHTFRRSGAQHLAKSGAPLDFIQYMARHSTQAVKAYVEQAMEVPRALVRLQEHFSVQEQIRALVAKCKSLEDMHKTAAAEIKELSASACKPSLDEKEVRAMLEGFLRPEVVLNCATLKVHSTQGCLFLDSPLEWATSCGWQWIRAGRMARVCSSRCDLPKAAALCIKCQERLPSWTA